MTATLARDDPAALLDWARADDADLRRLAPIAGLLDALFVLPSPDAPGAVVIGAAFAACGARFSATGAGATRRAALAACLGEAAETLAQCAPMRPALRAPLDAADHGLSPQERAACAARLRAIGLDPSAPLDWLAAETAAGTAAGAAGFVPAAFALRRGPPPPGEPLSLGCAAGPDAASARRAGALELFERAALARWRGAGGGWRDPEARAAATAALAALGRAAPAPEVLRLDADADPLPVVAALTSLGAGFAAGEMVASAAAAAARELAAAEAGARFAAARGAPPPAAWTGRAACGDGAPRATAPVADLAAATASLAAPLRVIGLEAPFGAASVAKTVCFALPAG